MQANPKSDRQAVLSASICLACSVAAFPGDTDFWKEILSLYVYFDMPGMLSCSIPLFMGHSVKGLNDESQMRQ